MSDVKRCIPWSIALLVSCIALDGCAPPTIVSATGNVPSQYTHVWLTAQAVWFNSNANAGPDDSGWAKFTLSTPVTFDLMSSNNGTLTQLATDLKVPTGTYNQVRLLPLEASSALATSASGAGLLYNSEVDYDDGSGGAQRAPLELQNPDKGIGLAATITVSAIFLASTSNLSASETTATTTPTTTDTTTTTLTTGTDTTTTPTTTGATGTSTTTPTSTIPATGNQAAPLSVVLNLNGARDLAPFTYGSSSGTLLSPHDSAYDASQTGGIQGSLAISSLTGVTGTNGRVNIQVTAETLSTDGTRHIPVNSALVQSGGAFLVYPLPTSASTAATYDLVIHGPGISTIIIREITVGVGSLSATTPVSVGTITPTAATSFGANVTAGTTPSPAGALVGFYQTLPGTGQVPYLIEERPLDPFNRTLATDQPVSAGPIQYGTFVSTLGTTLVTAPPAEGNGVYRVSAWAPLYAAGSLTTTATSPTVPKTTPSPLAPVSGAVLNSISADLSSKSGAPRCGGLSCNQGQLIVSRNGAVMATAPLDTVLAQGGQGMVSIPGIPGGSGSSSFAPAIYYLSLRLWNSTNPSGTLQRKSYPTPVDLRSASATGIALSID